MKPPAESTPRPAAATRHRIALVMIARDEARAIERCLRSVQPWVDEMIVLDTGSLDDTCARAQRCGAQVHAFTWGDDFSAARNAALALTQAEWRVVLDADEWLVAGGQSLARLAELGPAPGGFVGQIQVVSQLDNAGTLAPSWLPRVLPRGAGYSGRIHEQPDAGLPRRRLPLSIRHDGYLPTQMAAKAGRNRRLLEQALREHPGDAYWSYQLGKDFEVRALFDDAAPHYRRAHFATRAAPAGEVPWRHDLVVRLLFTLKRIGALTEAAALADTEQAAWADSPDYHFTLGDLWLECAIRSPQRAGEWLPRIEASWLRAIRIGEQPQLNDTVRGRGSFLAAHNLAVYYRSLGRTAEADEWERRAVAMRAQAERLDQPFRTADAMHSSEQTGSAPVVPAFDFAAGA